MTAAEFSALMLLSAATSFTPGPNTTLSTALAANFGLRRAMRFVCAVPVGWGLLFTLCAVGLGSLVVAQPALRWGILCGGVGYLLWLAWRLAMSVVAGWIAGRPDATERTLQVLPLMLAFGFFSNLTYATTGSLLRGWLAHGQRLLVFNRCMATALVLTAVWMLWSVR